METAHESPTPNNPVDQLQELLRQAELQNLQLQLELRFKKKYGHFKEAAPRFTISLISTNLKSCAYFIPTMGT